MRRLLRRHLTVLAVCLLLMALLVEAVPAQVEPAPEPPPPAEMLNAAFHDYGDRGASWQPGQPRTWTGADTTFSVELPDGRTVWIFSDTFLSPSNACAASDPQPCHKREFWVAPFINNSFIVQEADGTLSKTLYGGTDESPTALIRPPLPVNEGYFYWMGDGTVEGDRLHVFVRRYPKAPVLSPTALGTDIATFRLPDLTLESITDGIGTGGVRPWAFAAPPVGSVVPVTWGAGILEREDYTYIYGTEEYPLNKHLHVARVPSGKLLTAPWEYFDGTGWTTDALQSERVLADVAGELSVVETTHGFRLVTSRLGIAELLSYMAPKPEGPWGQRKELYVPPEIARGGSVYNAHEHPQYSRPGRLVFSYNVNGQLDGKDVFADIHVYRARFVEVRLDEPVAVVRRTRPSASDAQALRQALLRARRS